VVAVKRETIEETGYKIDNFEEISRFFVAPGCTDEQIILLKFRRCKTLLFSRY